MSGPSRRIRLTLPVSVAADRVLEVMRRQDNRLYLRGEVFWSPNAYANGDLLSVLRCYGFGVPADAANAHGQAVSTVQLVGMAEGFSNSVLLYSAADAKTQVLAASKSPSVVKMELSEDLSTNGTPETADAITARGQLVSTLQAIAMPSKDLVFGYGQTLGEFKVRLLATDPADAEEAFGCVRGYLVGSLNPGSDAGLAIMLTSVDESAGALFGESQEPETVLMVSDAEFETSCTAKALSSCTVTFMANGRVVHEATVLEGESCPDPVAENIISTPTKNPSASHTYKYAGWSKVEGGSPENGEVFLRNAEYTGFAYDGDYGVYACHTDDVVTGLNVGETYNVIWDGVSYSCLAQSLPGMDGIQIGNLSSFDGIGNNEPFAIGFGPYGTSFFSFDDKASHTVEIMRGGCLDNITSDITLYASFSEAIRKYNISFYDEGSLLATIPFAYGEIPYYTAIKDGLITAGWTPEPVPVTGDASYIAQWRAPSSLADAAWSEIAEVAESGNASLIYNLGDKKDFVAGGKTYTAQIVGFNLDTLSADNTKNAGISFLITRRYSQSIYLNSAAKWSNSQVRTLCADTIYPALQEDLRSVVKQVRKISATGAAKNAYVTTDDYVWIPSYGELGGKYFPAEPFRYPLFVDDVSRKSDAGQYSTRSTNIDSSQYWKSYNSAVDADGKLSATHYYMMTHYVRFGFCI